MEFPHTFESTHPLASRVLFTCIALGPVSSAQQTCTVERISLNHQGNQGSKDSGAPAISADGRFVAFYSFSSLVPADVGSRADVYLRDRVTGALELISVSSSGAGANANSPYKAAGNARVTLSDDGRKVCWVSEATDLAPNASYGGPKAFVRDRATGQTQLVSTSSSQPIGRAPTASLSADGRFVAFFCYSALLPNANSTGETYVRDLQTGAMEIASLDWNGQPTTSNNPVCPDLSIDLSADGRFVFFQSRAPNLVPVGNPLARVHVYRRDRLLGATEMVSVNDSGVPGDGDSSRSRCSADGRYAVFDSTARNLDGNDPLYLTDIFVRDMVLGTTRFVSRTSSGSVGDGHSSLPEISPEGRFVLYDTTAENLVAGDTNNTIDVHLYDRITGTTTRVSADSQGLQADDYSYFSSASWGAHAIAFDSAASNLVPSDTNSKRDVYLRECTNVLTYCTPKTNSLGCEPAIDAQGVPAITFGLPFEIRATNVRNQNLGSLVYGVAGAAAIPFHGGTLCLQQPVVKTPVQTSHGSTSGSDCSGTYGFDFLAWVATGIDPSLIAGAQVWSQYWSRDNGFLSPGNVGLTDAVTFTLEP
jgi:Tol biopolymer transport system component